jgi:ribonuclease HI
MANYVIRVDSSTRPTNTLLSKSGKSSAAWTTHVGGHLIGAGMIYYSHNGPNKSIYEGILAALSQLESEHFHPAGTDTVQILVDCQVVLNQLNGTANAVRMSKHKALVDQFMHAHPNVTFTFTYQNESVSEYAKVDRISKMGRTWLLNMLR